MIQGTEVMIQYTGISRGVWADTPYAFSSCKEVLISNTIETEFARLISNEQMPKDLYMSAACKGLKTENCA